MIYPFAGSVRATAMMVAGFLMSGLIETAYSQQHVSVELVLAADTSISVDQAEYRLQMLGIANALRAPAVIEQIEALPNGAAVALVHWSVAHLNTVAVDWHHLYDRRSVPGRVDIHLSGMARVAFQVWQDEKPDMVAYTIRGFQRSQD